MKNISIALILLLFIGCNDIQEKAVHELIIQNNKYYEVALAEYKASEKARESDSPATYDKEYHESVFRTIDAIVRLKDVKAYDTIFETIKKISYESKVKKIIDPIQSENKEILKNNLYVNLMNAIRAYKLNKPIGISTHCRLSDRFKIKKTIEKDSVKLDFYTFNPYQLDVDYFVDGSDTIYDYKYISDQAYKVWSIRYKPISKSTNCKGKIFFNELDNYNIIYIQEFDDKKKLSHYPF